MSGTGWLGGWPRPGSGGIQDLEQSLGYRMGGPIDGLIPLFPPFPVSHLSAFLDYSYSDGLTFFFFTKFSHEGLCMCYSFCARSLSPPCPVGSLRCFLQVTAQLSVCRRASLTASYKIATSHSLVLFKSLNFPS